MSSFDIPGDAGFPLNAFMTKPASKADAGKDIPDVGYSEGEYQCLNDSSPFVYWYEVGMRCINVERMGVVVVAVP